MLLVATATHFTSFRCEWYSPSASITHWRLKDGLSKRSPCLLIALGRIWVQIQRHLNLGKLPSDRKSAEWYCLQDPTGGCGKCGLWRGKNRNTSTVQSQGRRRKGEEKIGPKWARPLQLEDWKHRKEHKSVEGQNDSGWTGNRRCKRFQRENIKEIIHPSSQPSKRRTLWRGNDRLTSTMLIM